MTPNQDLARVIVVGGGYSGVAVSKLLDQAFKVILIEKNEMFFHNLGALRAAVDPNWLEKIFIPYDGLLKRGKILRRLVVEATYNQVLLDNGETLKFDYLVLASGSRYAFPAKISENIEGFKKGIFHLSEKIRAARRVLIVGGGPVGVELAGEIAGKYSQKAITLVHSGKTLIGAPFNPKLGMKLLDALQKMGVRVILDQKVFLDDIKLADLGQTQTYSTDQGITIEADILFTCYGTKVNNDYLYPHFAGQLDNRGRVKVNPQMQLEGYCNIFAVGDLTNVDEPKMGFLGESHASVAAANIKILQSGEGTGRQQTLKTYHPSQSPLIIVPLGENGGAGQFPLTKNGIVVGNFLAKQIKGKSLLAPRYWQKMGLKMPK